MNLEYDLFELIDGTLIWLGHAIGLDEAQRKLQQFCASTKNECLVMHVPTSQVVARQNVRKTDDSRAIIIQITYDDSLAIRRSDTLTLHSFEVSTLNGNDSAKIVLSVPHSCDVFLVGHGASATTRNEMAAWLKTRYPSVPIVALNASDASDLAGADYNVSAGGEAALLRVIRLALAHRASAEEPIL